MKYFIRLFSLLAIGALFFACNQQQGSSPAAPEIDNNLQSRRSGAAAFINREFQFDITIENLTPATGPGASQPFAPPVLATHTLRYHVFKVGTFATDELAQVAQDAVSAPMVEMLNESKRVYDVAQGDGVILPGKSTTIRIKAKPGYRFLSLVSMLVNTNDAFAGVDAIRLPSGGSKVVYLHAYDAGTEKNTESADDIPGPCCGSPFHGTPTHQRIHLHKGIMGIGDLSPDMYGWNDPVAKLTITLVE